MYDWSEVKQYEGVFDFTQASKIKLLPYQRDILEKVTTPHACSCPGDGPLPEGHPKRCANCKEGLTGLLPYSTVVWSQPKKHGKTQVAGGVAGWMACKVEAPNIILTMASSQEQSAGLIFNSIVPTLHAVGGKIPQAWNQAPEIKLPNGTTLKAIPNNYAAQAGGNYGGTFWSELWTYKSERDRRLWEELPPVPTRKNSIRWVETYAGFEDEKGLLLDLFLRVFEDTQETRTRKVSKAGNPVEPVPGLEHIQTGRGSKRRPSCWHIPAEGLFVFWDHEIRAHEKDGGWITDRYMAEQRAENRRSTYVRLWENRWQTSVGTFIEPELWDDAITLDGETWEPMVLAGDASQRNDTTALVGVSKREVRRFGRPQTRYRVHLVRAWDPRGEDIDLDETIAKYVKEVYDRGLLVGPFRYDPLQMHQVAVNLRKLGVPCKEFNQGQERLKADTFLWKQLNDRAVDSYDSPVLGDHVRAANAKEYENEQIRIIKGEASAPAKVDAAVALSMAVWAASGRIKRASSRKVHKTQSWSTLY